MDWLPIESAPKDNRDLILYFPYLPNRKNGGLSPKVTIECYPVPFPRQPTHWMPLPPPPQAAKE
jgi:hypothetical protein